MSDESQPAFPDDAQVVVENGRVIVKQTFAATLSRIETGQAAGFAQLRTALSKKADKSDIERVESSVGALAGRVTMLEAWRHDREVAEAVHQQRDDDARVRRSRIWSLRQKVLASGVGVAMVVVGVLEVVHH